jgi:hypothetical protein
MGSAVIKPMPDQANAIRKHHSTGVMQVSVGTKSMEQYMRRHNGDMAFVLLEGSPLGRTAETLRRHARTRPAV